MRRRRTKNVTAEQRRHHDALREIGCLISHYYPTIAHCHGGSVIDVLGYSANPGWAQRQNHWLVIPLSFEMHLGQFGLDTHKGGVRAWEKEHQTQIVLLEWVCHLTDTNVFENAGYEGYDFKTAGAWQSPRKPEPARQVALGQAS